MDFRSCSCTGMTLRGLVQPAVLTLLADGPLHGYRVVHRLAEMPLFCSHPPDATGVYRLLKSMADQGLLSACWDHAEKGPAKRRFELTPSGRACLGQWQQTLRAYASAIGDLLGPIERQDSTTLREEASSAVVRRCFEVAGEALDSLDLKVLLLNRGLHVREEVHRAYGRTHRLSADPLECSALFLPDQTVVHVAEVGPSADFHVAVGADGGLQLLHEGVFVTEVALPRATEFYRQSTSRGVPFRGMAVLQGHNVLTFPYLWPCDFAKAGQACRFCHCGNHTQRQWAAGLHQDTAFAPGDVAEAVNYAVCIERCAAHVQLTGGSSFNADGECHRMVELLEAIDRCAGLSRIPGEIILYTTPPASVKAVDQLFAAGATRVACDLEVWDESRAREICPGKAQWTGRQRTLDTLFHIAQTHGAFKACSTFVVGLEPAESFLAGAEYLAGHGIVPIPSIWMPHGLPPFSESKAPDLDFYRRIKQGLAAIYDRYACQPPGDRGFNVCLCRDTWNHRACILDECRASADAYAPPA